MKKWILLAVILGGTYFLMKKDHKAALVQWANTTGSDAATLIPVLNQMTQQEIDNTYDYVFNYFQKNIQVPVGSALYNAIQAISTKYNIFT